MLERARECVIEAWYGFVGVFEDLRRDFADVSVTCYQAGQVVAALVVIAIGIAVMVAVLIGLIELIVP